MPTPTGTLSHGQIAGCNSTADLHCTADKHGDEAAYRRGCRCDLARHAISKYEKARQLDILKGRSRTLANVGAIRRLHALRALGYASRDLANRIGVDERNIARWPHRTWISRGHHDAVCRVYLELADTIGPDTRARRHAARQGWLPPIWWDDDLIDDPAYDPLVIDDTQFVKSKEQEEFFHNIKSKEFGARDNDVDGHLCHRFTNDFIIPSPQYAQIVDSVAIERALAGDRSVKLTRNEALEAVRQLTAAGRGPGQIATRLHMSGATVISHLRQLSTAQRVEQSAAPQSVGAHRYNDSGAEQRANATRPLTETPECPGGRPVPSIPAAASDSFRRAEAIA